jgi:hypothetical protein
MLFSADSEGLPKRKDLPKIQNAPDGAAWFWGQNDEVNFFLLTNIFYTSSLMISSLAG